MVTCSTIAPTSIPRRRFMNWSLHPAFEETDRNRLLKRIADEELPPSGFDKSAPRDLETIVFKALAKDQNDRYAGARELAEDLRRFVDDKPIVGAAAEPDRQARQVVARNKPIVLAGRCCSSPCSRRGPTGGSQPAHLRQIAEDHARREADARLETESERNRAEANLAMGAASRRWNVHRACRALPTKTPQAELFRLAFLRKQSASTLISPPPMPAMPPCGLKWPEHAAGRAPPTPGWVNMRKARRLYRAACNLFEEEINEKPDDRDFSANGPVAATISFFARCFRRRVRGKPSSGEPRGINRLRLIAPPIPTTPFWPSMCIQPAQHGEGRLPGGGSVRPVPLKAKEQLVADYPGNAEYRHFLSFSFHDLGDVLRRRGG